MKLGSSGGDSSLCGWAGLVGVLLWAGVQRVWAREMEPGEMLVSAAGAPWCCYLGCCTTKGCLLPWMSISDGLTPCGDACDASERARGIRQYYQAGFPDTADLLALNLCLWRGGITPLTQYTA